MKRTEFKQKYQRPTMKVVEMKSQSHLLAGSPQSFQLNNAQDIDEGELD